MIFAYASRHKPPAARALAAAKPAVSATSWATSSGDEEINVKKEKYLAVLREFQPRSSAYLERQNDTDEPSNDTDGPFKKLVVALNLDAEKNESIARYKREQVSMAQHKERMLPYQEMRHNKNEAKLERRAARLGC